MGRFSFKALPHQFCRQAPWGPYNFTVPAPAASVPHIFPPGVTSDPQSGSR